MPREKVDFRDNLAFLASRFPDRAGLELNECCELFHCDRKTIMEDTEFPHKKISGKIVIPIPALAKWMS